MEFRGQFILLKLVDQSGGGDIISDYYSYVKYCSKINK